MFMLLLLMSLSLLTLLTGGFWIACSAIWAYRFGFDMLTLSFTLGLGSVSCLLRGSGRLGLEIGERGEGEEEGGGRGGLGGPFDQKGLFCEFKCLSSLRFRIIF